jgi:acetoin utilization deacetylase AcuC-like enzyme
VFFEKLELALTAIRAYRSDVLVFSLGFDIYKDDPQTQVAVTSEGFHRLGQAVAGLNLPTVFIQEGGYHIERLAHNTQQFFTGALQRTAP